MLTLIIIILYTLYVTCIQMNDYVGLMNKNSPPTLSKRATVSPYIGL